MKAVLGARWLWPLPVECRTERNSDRDADGDSQRDVVVSETDRNSDSRANRHGDPCPAFIHEASLTVELEGRGCTRPEECNHAGSASPASSIGGGSGE